MCTIHLSVILSKIKNVNETWNTLYPNLRTRTLWMTYRAEDGMNYWFFIKKYVVLKSVLGNCKSACAVYLKSSKKLEKVKKFEMVGQKKAEEKRPAQRF